MYRVLKEQGRLDRWNRTPSKKGTGFAQPVAAHDHWHIDVSYLNIAGTFYYLCTILDGYSRIIVHWDIRERMTDHREIAERPCRFRGSCGAMNVDSRPDTPDESDVKTVGRFPTDCWPNGESEEAWKRSGAVRRT